MCYHNSLNTKPGELAKRYGLPSGSSPEFTAIGHVSGFSFPKWPILTTQTPTSFLLGGWGLVPSWVKETGGAQKVRKVTLNARVETLQEKPSFKGALTERKRCLVPSTGFFEWQQVGKKKIPHFVAFRDMKIFSMAGLWDLWIDGETGNETLTFTIITVPANPLMAKIHNQKERMPAILEPQNEKQWLDTSLPDFEINELLCPIHERFLTAYSIKSPLNADNASFDEITQRRDYPELSKQQTLF